MIKNKTEKLEIRNLDQVSSCPVCHSKRKVNIGKNKTIHPKSSHKFQINKCLSCGHWFTNPTPRQSYLNMLYGQGSLSVFGDSWVNQTTKEKRKKINLSKIIKENWIAKRERAQSPGTYLEIGPGNCKLFECFNKLNWTCYAIEPGSWIKKSTNFFKKITSLPKDILFDVVVLENVLEHMSKPDAFLEELSKKIKQGGRVYFQFPNSESLRAKAQGGKWRMVRPIGHLHYFSRKSLNLLLLKNDLSPIYVKNYDFIHSCDEFRSVINKTIRNLVSFKFKEIQKALLYSVDYTISIICSVFKIGDQWKIIALKR